MVVEIANEGQIAPHALAKMLLRNAVVNFKRVGSNNLGKLAVFAAPVRSPLNELPKLGVHAIPVFA